MSTRTKSNSRTQATIVLDPEVFEVSGLESGSAGAERSELDERPQRAGGQETRCLSAVAVASGTSGLRALCVG
jgi:hypothetical protein